MLVGAERLGCRCAGGVLRLVRRLVVVTCFFGVRFYLCSWACDCGRKFLVVFVGVTSPLSLSLFCASLLPFPGLHFLVVFILIIARDCVSLVVNFDLLNRLSIYVNLSRFLRLSFFFGLVEGIALMINSNGCGHERGREEGG